MLFGLLVSNTRGGLLAHLVGVDGGDVQNRLVLGRRLGRVASVGRNDA